VKSRILRGRRALKDLLEPLLVDRSASAPGNDRPAIAHEEADAAGASADHGSAAAHSNARANVGARFSASSSASSRMPRPAFAPHFGPHTNTVSARSRFARESSASEELP